jgi:methionyl-tRNA formyltransferase
MRIIFMGTPSLAACCLHSLAAAGYDIPLVVTQPDRPKGRGRKLVFSPVKEEALALGIQVFQPERLRDTESQRILRELAPDLIVVAAFGQILPKAVLDLPPLGCLNVHASLLPAYRGAAPIQWAILDGQKETGITIMLMEEGLDTGPMLMQKRMPISEEMTGEQLYDSLSQLGAEALIEAIPLWAKGQLQPIAQDDTQSTYAVRLERKHEKIQWERSSDQLRNQIRAFHPWPGAFAIWKDKEVKILAAHKVEPEERAGFVQALKEEKPELDIVPGLVLGIYRKKGPLVETGEGALLLTQIQPVGKQPMDGASFVNGYRVSPGDMFQ